MIDDVLAVALLFDVQGMAAFALCNTRAQQCMLFAADQGIDRLKRSPRSGHRQFGGAGLVFADFLLSREAGTRLLRFARTLQARHQRLGPGEGIGPRVG